MRFEIKGWGAFAIFLSLAVLSGAVFFCGILAGYDVGRQSQLTAADVATTYTIPSAPLAVASPPAAVAAMPAAIAANETPPAAADDDSAPPERRSGAKASADDTGESVDSEPSPAAKEPARTASLSPDYSGDISHSSAAHSADTDDHADTSNEEAPPLPPKRHAFNIQIQAVMDATGANQMIRRLARIGYPAHMVATPIDGQTWYKVEVGPYPTQEEAAAAQASMRQKYNDTYGSAHTSAASSSASGSATGTTNNEDE